MQSPLISHGSPLTVRPPRILVVDDETSFTRLLKINLESTGRYLVKVENSPRLARAAALEFHPDLVLLDVMMPDFDGGDVANQLARDPMLKAIPIVFLTAAVRHAEVDAHHGTFGGMRFLSKPVSLPDLITCLDEVLAAHHLHA